ASDHVSSDVFGFAFAARNFFPTARFPHHFWQGRPPPDVQRWTRIWHRVVSRPSRWILDSAKNRVCRLRSSVALQFASHPTPLTFSAAMSAAGLPRRGLTHAGPPPVLSFW